MIEKCACGCKVGKCKGRCGCEMCRLDDDLQVVANIVQLWDGGKRIGPVTSKEPDEE